MANIKITSRRWLIWFKATGRRRITLALLALGLLAFGRAVPGGWSDSLNVIAGALFQTAFGWWSGHE